jgi:hypothetical protein
MASRSTAARLAALDVLVEPEIDWEEQGRVLRIWDRLIREARPDYDTLHLSHFIGGQRVPQDTPPPPKSPAWECPSCRPYIDRCLAQFQADATAFAMNGDWGEPDPLPKAPACFEAHAELTDT